MMNTEGEGGCRYPFTANQWQELEHQALVYKYLISGMPIPPHLIFTIRTSLDSSSTKLLFHHQTPQPSIGWKCFQMGFGRKIDPEPGRCRRTDGKKWRCSKEAYTGSKYCERHMHRGRNRSRKSVEVNMSTPSPTAKSPNYPSPNSHQLSSPDYYNNNNNTLTHVSSYSRSSSNLLSSQHQFLLDSRKSYEMKREMDHEHPFFSESSGTIKTSMGDSKERSYSEYDQNGYSYQQQDQGVYNYDQLGLKIERKDEPQKVMHHFFDEWPRSNNKDSSSTTQLTISIRSSDK